MSSADEGAVLRALWGVAARDASRPGPKPSITLVAILDAGIAVADDRAGPALSMRTVADRLGCTPMALYTHVPSRDALQLLMVDRVHRELPAVESVQGWAGAVAELHARHHWIADVSWARPIQGPNEQRTLERLLELLAGLDLRPGTSRTVASAVYALSREAGRLIGDARFANATGEPEDRWWAAHSATMAQLVPDFAARYPRSASLEGPGWPPEGEAYLEWLARTEMERAVGLVLAGAGLRPGAPPRG